MKIEYCQKCDRGIKSGEEKAYIKDGQTLCEECYLRATKQELERAASEKVHGKSQDELEAKSLKKQRKSKKNKDRETAIAGAIGITFAIVILLMILKGLSFNETADRKYRPTQSRAKTEYAKARTEEEQKVSDVGGIRGVFISGMRDADVIRLVKKTLTQFGLLGVTARVADGRRMGGVKCLIVGFRSRALPQRESAPKEVFLELSSILGVYIGARREGWDVDELSVALGDITGGAVGIFYCEKEWADDVVKEPTVESLGLLSLRVFNTFTPLLDFEQ